MMRSAIKTAGFAVSIVLACMSLARGAEHPDARTADLNTLKFKHAPGAQALEIGSATPLRHLDLELSADVFHARRPLGMYSDQDERWLRSFVEQHTGVRAGAAVGLLGRIQLSLALPAIINQDTQWPGFGLGATESSGMGDMEIEFKYRLHAPINGFTTSIVVPLTAPTGTENAWLSDGHSTYSPSVIVSRRAGAVEVSFKGGYRWMDTTSIFDVSIGSAVLGGVGIRRQIPELYDGLSVAASASGELSTASRRLENASGGMWTSGVYVHLFDQWALGGIVGGALTRTSNIPSFHAGLRLTHTFVFGVHPPVCTRVDAWKKDDRCPPPDSDSDGLNDAVDQCVDEPEDLDSFEDADGCPDPDNDEDRHLDAQDKCPLDPEDYDDFEDTDGCPELDNDGDGINDAQDQCPNTPENMNGLEDKDGCPEPDRDNDGVLDTVDACPDNAEDKDGFLDEDGCPDEDNDEDGIPDTSDICPMKPENINGFKDKDGCPDEVLAVKTKNEIRITEKIHFIHGQVVPRKKSRKVLRAILRILKANPDLRIRVEGHTDSVGGDEFNYLLSQARAQAIKDWMIRKGGPEQRLEARLEVLGVGKESPIDDNTSKEGRAKNRRVKFIIIDEAGRPIDAEAPSK